MTRRRMLAAATALGATLGCAPGATTPSAPTAPLAPASTASTATPVARRFGVAGLTPARFPGSSAEDWQAFYRTIGDVGGLLGVYVEWSEAGEETIPKAIVDSAGNAKQFGFTPLVLLGAQRLAGDAAQAKRLREMAAKIARDQKPRYMGIGNEVNLLARNERARYDALRRALPDVRAAVKEASPDTSVFTVFQLELLVGGAYLLTTARRSDPQWPILDEMAAAIDVAAFTTYPYLDYESPAAIPDDHWAQVAKRLSIPIGFTEVGWPSRPFSTAPSSGHGGSAEEQAAFAARFLSLIRPLEPAFALWLFMHDIAGAGPSFESNGLRENDGTAKPAFAAWRRAGA